ncbi:MAG: o-succinylbenzoate synthase [Candidatus Hydrogenedentes bacterium]|nr:o-succinylbenzoate synthase [Candidatus Hydrogenedentota bacterium]
MRIASATFHRYSLPFHGVMQFRSERVRRRDGLIISIHSDDGSVGYGEIAPLPGFSKENLKEAHAAARRCIESLKIRANIDPQIPAGLRDREMFPPSVRFGVECALWDLAVRTNRAIPARMFVNQPAVTVPVNMLLMEPTNRMIARAQAFASAGFQTLKLKVGRESIDHDLNWIQQIREAVGPNVEIRMDANRAWQFDDALRFVNSAAEFDVSYIEEPIDQPERLLEFSARSPIPIAVDETLQDAGWEKLFGWREAEVLEAGCNPESRESLRSELGTLERGIFDAILAARVWVVKPSLVGFPLKYTAQLLSGKQRIDADLVISSSFESGLGLIALANLAACAGQDALPAGLDTAASQLENVLPIPLPQGAFNLAELNTIAARFNPGALEVVQDD